MVIALRGHRLQANFERVLVWCVASGALAVGGGFAHGSARYVLWVLAVGVDLAGGAVGFIAPGLGRSRTSDWTIRVATSPSAARRSACPGCRGPLSCPGQPGTSRREIRRWPV